MTAPTVQRPVADAADPRPVGAVTRRWTVAGTVGLLAALVVAALLAAGLLGGAPQRVATSFGDDPRAIDSSWGNLEHFGVAGSWIVVYQHGTQVTAELAWGGDEVVDAAWPASDEEHLLEIVEVTTVDDVAHVTMELTNCRFYNERELDIFTTIELLDVDGDRHEVLFGKPLLVHSPMLHGCPDRTLDRQDDVRGETFRR